MAVLPCLWMAVQSRGSGCSPGANKAPQEIRSNQDLKGASISQERGQNPAHFCCFASVPMKNNGSHCQSSRDPRAFFWPPLAGVSCSKALAARYVTKSVGQREEYLPSKARGEATDLLRALFFPGWQRPNPLQSHHCGQPGHVFGFSSHGLAHHCLDF